jgi:DNA-binding IclR family transcriptional regulator
MKDDPNEAKTVADAEGRSYSAPALEKGLDILETLCRSEKPLSQKDLAQRLGLTTKLFELAHVNPPTHRLLFEAAPIMQRLASELDQSCHLTVYGQGKQVVLSKVDTPSGMGFAVRAGAELDVIISASGRVLLAFQDEETRKLRIEESLQRRPEQADPQFDTILDKIRVAGYESSPSVQVRGLWAVSFPVLDTQGRAIAALTVPYAERIDQMQRKSIPEVTAALGAAARTLSARIGGMVSTAGFDPMERESVLKRSLRSDGR